MILSQVLEQGISKKCKYASSLIMHQNNVAYFSERTWNHCTMAADKEKNLQVLLWYSRPHKKVQVGQVGLV